MTSLHDHVIAVLAPYVGHAVAETCVRSTALSLGKTADTLARDDLPALKSTIHRLLEPVAPSYMINDLLTAIGREP